MEEDFDLHFDISREDYEEDQVKKIFDNLHEFLSDFDSSGGLLVGGPNSVTGRLGDDVDEDILMSIREVESIFDSSGVEDVENLMDLIVEFMEGKDNSDQIEKEMNELRDNIREARSVFEKDVFMKLEETTSNNVGYAMAYLERMENLIEEVNRNF